MTKPCQMVHTWARLVVLWGFAPASVLRAATYAWMQELANTHPGGQGASTPDTEIIEIKSRWRESVFDHVSTRMKDCQLLLSIFTRPVSPTCAFRSSRVTSSDISTCPALLSSAMLPAHRKDEWLCVSPAVAASSICSSVWPLSVWLKYMEAFLGSR